jgi:flagellar hook-length control protein FliK
MRDLAPLGTKSVESAAAPRSLDGLVREIVVAAGPGLNSSVEVQFQSATLDGLNVRISRKGDGICVRFLTSSDSVAQLLIRNSSQLSEALLARGLHVAPIQIERAPAPSRTAESASNRDQSGNSRERGEGRQERRHR